MPWRRRLYREAVDVAAGLYTWLMSVTVELPDDMLARLQAEAARRGVSVDAVITELVAQLPVDTPAPAKRNLAFIGMGASTSGRRARDADEMLAEGFGRD